MHMKDSRCDGLVKETAAALNKDTVALMLLAIQRGNIDLSVNTALNRSCPSTNWVRGRRSNSGMSYRISIHLGKSCEWCSAFLCLQPDGVWLVSPDNSDSLGSE
ncbi:hypothetical protein EI94DRAFT_665315 [Lactarius quietus]|nr:hypothetical protein EI94DRAFT_665315 [Lactarius quietus]